MLHSHRQVRSLQHLLAELIFGVRLAVRLALNAIKLATEHFLARLFEQNNVRNMRLYKNIAYCAGKAGGVE